MLSYRIRLSCWLTGTTIGSSTQAQKPADGVCGVQGQNAHKALSLPETVEASLKLVQKGGLVMVHLALIRAGSWKRAGRVKGSPTSPWRTEVYP